MFAIYKFDIVDQFYQFDLIYLGHPFIFTRSLAHAYRKWYRENWDSFSCRHVPAQNFIASILSYIIYSTIQLSYERINTHNMYKTTSSLYTCTKNSIKLNPQITFLLMWFTKHISCKKNHIKYVLEFDKFRYLLWRLKNIMFFFL